MRRADSARTEAAPSDTAWVTLFGSARPRPGSPLYELAREAGRAVGAAGFGLCNGGYGGTMEGSAVGARACGAPVRGVTLAEFGPGNDLLTEGEEAATLFERIERLMAPAAALLVLPGGTGTLMEIAAALELSAKAFQRVRPIYLLGEFWRPTIENVLPEMRLNALEPLARRPRAPSADALIFCADIAALSAKLRALAANLGVSPRRPD